MDMCCWYIVLVWGAGLVQQSGRARQTKLGALSAMLLVVMLGCAPQAYAVHQHGDDGVGDGQNGDYQIRRLQSNSTINCSSTNSCAPGSHFCATAQGDSGVCTSCTSPSAACGCTDKLAPNYNASAAHDDGNCSYSTLCQSSSWTCHPSSVPTACKDGQCAVTDDSAQKWKEISKNTNHVFMFAAFVKQKAVRCFSHAK